METGLDPGFVLRLKSQLLRFCYLDFEASEVHLDLLRVVSAFLQGTSCVYPDHKLLRRVV